MPSPRLAFVLAATDHGPLIVNRLDYRRVDAATEYGVGGDLLRNGSYAREDIDLLGKLLTARRQFFGDGVMVVDCGANIGVHTVDLAKRMAGWGNILAVEAQERLFYALAGNIALNNCANARAVLAALTAVPGIVRIPVPDYTQPGSFGSLELRPSETTEFIGQPIDYAPTALVEIPGITIDSLVLQRLDLAKIDVEGMELEVLSGMRATLDSQHPILFVEHIKAGKEALTAVLEPQGYKILHAGMNILAIHNTDPVARQVNQT